MLLLADLSGSPQCYDSLHPTKVVPHTAFVNEDARPGAAPRQSIEVRALVFFHE